VTAELKTNKTTLKELGPNLPMGVIAPDGSVTKSIEIRPWRMKEEKELGLMRDSNRSENIARWVTRVLSSMCTRLGSLDLADMKMNERIIHIGQLPMGDILYAYMWLRYKSLGNVVPMDINCSACRKEFTISADLETLEVITCDNLDNSLWEYQLRDPFEIRGHKVTGFQMAPARWNAMENQTGGGTLDTGAAKSSVITGSIYRLLNIDEPMVLTENELDEMTKYDLERMTALIDEKHIGPNMAIEGACTRCKRPFKTSIDWTYDSFFGISSH
jgi:hypothetical protein